MTGRILLSDKGLFLDGNFVLGIQQAAALDLSDPDGALGVSYTHPCHCELGCSYCRPDDECLSEVFVQESDLLALGLWTSNQQCKPTAEHTQAIADKLAVALVERRHMIMADTQPSTEVRAA